MPFIPTEALDFNELRRANIARNDRWIPAGLNAWSSSDWLTAIAGELGELAGVVVKFNRERDSLRGNKTAPTLEALRSEVADVAIYLDLFAASLGIDMGEAIRAKFNETSERVGFPERL